MIGPEMTVTDTADNYERVVLFTHRSKPLIGEITFTEIVVMRCNTCFALVQVDDIEDHSRYHDRVAKQAKFQARLNSPNRLLR